MVRRQWPLAGIVLHAWTEAGPMIEGLEMIVWLLLLIALIPAALLLGLAGALGILAVLVRKSPRRQRKH